MLEVFLGVGSNVDRERSIAAGLRALSEHFGALTVSSVYESDPVGFAGDPFFNLVVGFRTVAPVWELADQLAAIEREAGRTRGDEKFAARTLDLDLLLYGDAVLNHGSLRIPREDITRYAFVLEPLHELAPQRRHPVLGHTFAALWEAFDKRSLRQRRLDLSLLPS